jgi:hypothetical protein
MTSALSCIQILHKYLKYKQPGVQAKAAYKIRVSFYLEPTVFDKGPGSSVGIATAYGLDGPGI